MQAMVEDTKAEIIVVREADNLVNNTRLIHAQSAKW